MTPAVLFSADASTIDEYKICKEFFPTYHYRSEITNKLVIPRYSALPYYKELETDLGNNGCQLINSYKQHKWVAKAEWIRLKELHNATFPTYTDENFYEALEGEYIVKGKTNSRKLSWSTKMYAKSKREALNIAGELMQDPLIAEQGVIYRQYIPLETWEIGINGLRFTNEWRFFFLGTELIDFGYYWSLAEEETLKKSKSVKLEPLMTYAKKLARIVAEYCNFFVLDLAFTESGHIILVEINDGSMSGLSCIEPIPFYSQLANSSRVFGQKKGGILKPL
jgi:hypothetical protein